MAKSTTKTTAGPLLIPEELKPMFDAAMQQVMALQRASPLVNFAGPLMATEGGDPFGPPGPTSPGPYSPAPPAPNWYTGSSSSQDMIDILKDMGYGKKARKAMPLSQALSLVGGNVDTLGPLFESRGIPLSTTWGQFMKGDDFTAKVSLPTLIQQVTAMSGPSIANLFPGQSGSGATPSGSTPPPPGSMDLHGFPPPPGNTGGLPVFPGLTQTQQDLLKTVSDLPLDAHLTTAPTATYAAPSHGRGGGGGGGGTSAPSFGSAALTSPEQAAIDALRVFTEGTLGSTPALQAQQNAFKMLTVPTIMQNLAMAGLGNSGAVGSSIAEAETAALVPLLQSEAANRLSAAGQLGGIGSSLGNRELGYSGLNEKAWEAALADALGYAGLDQRASEAALQASIENARLQQQTQQWNAEQMRKDVLMKLGVADLERQAGLESFEAQYNDLLRRQGLSQSGSLDIFNMIAGMPRQTVSTSKTSGGGGGGV